MAIAAFKTTGQPPVKGIVAGVYFCFACINHL